MRALRFLLPIAALLVLIVASGENNDTLMTVAYALGGASVVVWLIGLFADGMKKPTGPDT